MFGANNTEIAPVEGSNMADVQPFTQRDDAAVYKIELSAAVCIHDLSDTC
jgi:hypothetical protein